MIRKFATPMVIGGIVLSGVTGALMYFDAEVGFNKQAHKIFGWALLMGVVLHISTHWPQFKQYLSPRRPLSLGVIGVFLFVLVSSFLAKPPPDQKPPPSRMALNALLKSPLSVIAQVAHQDATQLVAVLQSAGFAAKSPDDTLESLASGGRETQNKAFEIIFNH